MFTNSFLDFDYRDACTKIVISLVNPNLSEVERSELQAEKAMHLHAASDQRRAMSAFVKEYVPVHSPLQSLLAEVIPDHLETPIERPDHQMTMPFIQIQIEDFGGSLPLPVFGNRRPSADYFNSNLMLHNFVIADISRGVNDVFLYDEPMRRDLLRTPPQTRLQRWPLNQAPKERLQSVPAPSKEEDWSTTCNSSAAVTSGTSTESTCILVSTSSDSVAAVSIDRASPFSTTSMSVASMSIPSDPLPCNTPMISTGSMSASSSNNAPTPSTDSYSVVL
ncbi:hypothetical protein GQ600_1583 [Phytophthora cactorum]|nr:hypothetical protein GQ600_1583 [Phytophthora cactorum]